MLRKGETNQIAKSHQMKYRASQSKHCRREQSCMGGSQITNLFIFIHNAQLSVLALKGNARTTNFPKTLQKCKNDRHQKHFCRWIRSRSLSHCFFFIGDSSYCIIVRDVIGQMKYAWMYYAFNMPCTFSLSFEASQGILTHTFRETPRYF